MLACELHPECMQGCLLLLVVHHEIKQRGCHVKGIISIKQHRCHMPAFGLG
jgi:hypothetical protein